MGRQSRKRQDQRAARETAESQTRERLTAEVPSLLSTHDDDFLDLFPRTRVELIVAAPVKWRVLRTRDEIRAEALADYNTAVFSDRHYRLSHLPRDTRHPLSEWPDPEVWQETPDFAEQINALHNQVRITGTVNSHECVMLHLSGIYPSTLFIGDVCLANPRIAATQPMGLDQRFAGLGNGVFPEFLKRLNSLGSKLGFNTIRAHAVDSVRASVFQRKGFQLDDLDPLLLQAARFNGRQIPLKLTINSNTPSTHAGLTSNQSLNNGH